MIVYVIMSHGIPTIVHGTFNDEETAYKQLNILEKNNNEGHYRIFSVMKMTLNKLYENGSDFA